MDHTAYSTGPDDGELPLKDAKRDYAEPFDESARSLCLLNENEYH